MPALWVSPLRDILGFLRRYFVVAGTIAIAGAATSLTADRIDNYALFALSSSDGTMLLCNFSLAARLVFVLLVAMELATIAALVLVAANRGRRLPKGSPALNLPSPRILIAVAVTAGLLFLHLGLYAIAFHAADACAPPTVGAWLRNYAALLSLAALYIVGSMVLVAIVMLALKPMLLAK